MLPELIRFEWGFHVRQAAFRIAVPLALGLGWVLPAVGYGPQGTHLNSPFTVMQSVGLLSLLSIFVLTVFCANAVSRDAEHGMREIVFATSIGKFRYLAARFAGALAATVTVFCFAIVGLLAAPLFAEIDPARLGPPSPGAYLWALAVMALPNLLFAGAVVFAIAVLSRSVLASYVGGVFLYMGYMVVVTLIDSPLIQFAAPTSPETLARAALIDPFGISAFFQQAWYWTPVRRNTQLVELQGYFLANRLLVVALAAAILTVTYRVFSFRLAASAPPARAAAEASPAPGRRYRPAPVAPESAAGRWAAVRAAMRVEFRGTAASKPFLALLLLWVSVAAISVVDGPVKEYRTRLYPTTGTMLEALEMPLAFMATLMIAYFAAEVVWRERLVRADEIVDATPAPSAAFYLAKAGALVLLAWLMAAVGIMVAVGYQLSMGYTRLQPGVYLSIFWFTGLPLAIFAVVAVLVQTLSPNRYLGILVALLPGMMMLQPESFRLRHGLLRFANPPRVAYSEMNGFLGAGTFALYMAYWAGLAGVLALVTVGLWRRGRLQTLWRRTRALPRRWGGRGLAGALACLAVFLATGGFVFYNTNILGPYETGEDIGDWREAYERTYRRYEHLPQPSAVALRTAVEFFPEERRFRVAGTYSLENRSGRPIDTVLVSIRRELRPEVMELRGARLLRYDIRFGTYLFVLDRPLAPRQGTELRFRIPSPPHRVESAGFDYSVVDNGSYLTRQAAFPRLGYVVGYELEHPYIRRLRGLPPPRKGTGMQNDPSNDDQRDLWLTLDATVSTSGDQVAIAPGELVREWRQGGRRYFRYRTAGPETPTYAFASARYQVRRVNHRGVRVEVYHHPDHGANVAKMLAVATRSIDLFSDRYGPYPRRHLRIAELPRYWPFGGFALPGMIVLTEDGSFLTHDGRGGEVDLVTRRVAHEVSHQWWGHWLYPARVEGGAMLVETLASYSDLRALEAMRGRAQALSLLRYDRELYLLWRTYLPIPEPPLTRVVDLEHVYYSKGTIVMDAIRDLMGEDALDRALRHLVRTHGPGMPRATVADLRAALWREAAPEHQALISEWIDGVTFYHLRVESATAQPLHGGRYRVTAKVRARKTNDPGGGTPVTEAPLDEAIDVAVFAADPIDTGATPLYAGKHRLRGGLAEVTFEMQGRPGYISLDPFERRIEAERADNVRQVTIRQ
jgi:ABC-2 type transport system permease protein